MTEEHKEFKTVEEMLAEWRPLPWYRLIFVRTGQAISEVRGTIIHAWQRLTRGYDDMAWWEMDAYLATLIPKLVTRLRERGNGMPANVFEGLTPDENHCYTDADQATATAKWHGILTEIEEGFKEYLEYQRCELPYDHKLEKFNKGFDLFREYFMSLWD